MTLKSRNASFVEFVATLLSTELQVKYDDDEFLQLTTPGTMEIGIRGKEEEVGKCDREKV